jgi:hypothetical protein
MHRNHRYKVASLSRMTERKELPNKGGIDIWDSFDLFSL